MSDLDPYRALGIGEDATPSEIRAAFRRAVRRAHPDTNASPEEDTTAVRDVIAAYHMLIDPEPGTVSDPVDHRGPSPAGHRVEVRRGKARDAAGPCRACRGTGVVSATVECPTCRGSAGITDLSGARGRVVPCRTCGGRARVRSSLRCEDCAGSGTAPAP